MKRAILIVDHGSRSPEANAQLAEVAARVRARAPAYAVEIAHLELGPPDIAAGIAACAAIGVEQVVVVPYFLGPGRHTSLDIPRQVGDAARLHPRLRIEIAAALGPHERLIDILLERTAEVE